MVCGESDDDGLLVEYVCVMLCFDCVFDELVCV